MKHLLVYDDACGPCARFRDVVEAVDFRHRLDYVGLDEAETSGKLDTVPRSRRHRSFHLVSLEGRVWSGASAIPPLTALIPGGRALSEAMKVPPVSSVTAFVYAVFSRLHDSGSCGHPVRPPTAAQAGSQLSIDLDIDVDRPPRAVRLTF